MMQRGLGTRKCTEGATIGFSANAANEMAQSKLSLSECRIRKLLPGDQGTKTIGSGCIVSLKLRGEGSSKGEALQYSVALITTTQVITKNDLQSTGASTLVDFLDKGNGKLVTFNMSFKRAADVSDILPGRVLEGTEDALKEVSFIIIPVEIFDDTNRFKRFFKKAYSSLRGTSFEKRSLPCSNQCDENLRKAISNRQVLCHIVCDGRSADCFSTEPYRLEFGTEDHRFKLSTPVEHDGDDDVKQLKDFKRGERPLGAPLLNDGGKFLGMLAITRGDERKLFPLFLPVLDEDVAQSYTPSKDEWNNHETNYAVVSEDIKVEPETPITATGASDQVVGGESSREDGRHNSTTSDNNQNLTQRENVETNCTMSVVQGSGNTTASPLRIGNNSDELAANNVFTSNNILPPQHSHLPPVSRKNILDEHTPGELCPQPSVTESSTLDESPPDGLSPVDHAVPSPDPQLPTTNENNSLDELVSDESFPQLSSVASSNLDKPTSDRLSLGENAASCLDIQLPNTEGNNSLDELGSDGLSYQLSSVASSNLNEPTSDLLSTGDNTVPCLDPQLQNREGDSLDDVAPDRLSSVERPLPPQLPHLQSVDQDSGARQDLGANGSLKQVYEELLDDSVNAAAQLELNENVHQSQNRDQSIRPSMLTQNSCHDEATDESSCSFGVDETASPKPFATPSFTVPNIASIEGTSSSLGREREPESSIAIGPSSTSSRAAPHNSSSGEREQVKPDDFVKDKIIRNATIMDTLPLYLDRSVCPGSKDVPVTQRWEHLADEFKVPDETRKRCENLLGKSPSESMFDHLSVTKGSLPIKTLKFHLCKLGRNDVVSELDENSILSRDQATIAHLCKDHSETLNSVCLKLDDVRSPNNWKHLGIRLKIPQATLRKFKDPSDYSPSQVVLKAIETSKPNPVRIEEMQKVLRNDLKLPDIANLLKELQDGGTIKTLLDNDDLFDEVTAMLDLQESSWFRFGRKFDIERQVLESLKPDPVPSPTKVLLQYITNNDPKLTMEKFMRILVKIKRFDVITELRGFFSFTWDVTYIPEII